MSELISGGRRSLLRSAALLSTAPAFALRTANTAVPQALPAALAIGTPKPLRTLLQYSPVAGFQYHRGEDLWSSLRTGEALTMVREPLNAYDSRAVRLDWEGQKIGYVPALDNAAICQLLDRNECLDCVITQLRESSNPWKRVEFAVYLKLLKN